MNFQTITASDVLKSKSLFEHKTQMKFFYLTLMG